MTSEPLPLFALDAGSPLPPSRRRQDRPEPAAAVTTTPYPDAPGDPQVRKLLLTPTEAARTLGIGRSKLYELLRSGLIESVLIGSARRIPSDALDAYVDRLRPQTVR